MWPQKRKLDYVMGLELRKHFALQQIPSNIGVSGFGSLQALVWLAWRPVQNTMNIFPIIDDRFDEQLAYLVAVAMHCHIYPCSCL